MEQRDWLAESQRKGRERVLAEKQNWGTGLGRRGAAFLPRQATPLGSRLALTWDLESGPALSGPRDNWTWKARLGGACLGDLQVRSPSASQTLGVEGL